MKREEWEELKKRYEEAKEYSERTSFKERRLISDFDFFVRRPTWLDVAKEKLDKLKDYIED